MRKFSYDTLDRRTKEEWFADTVDTTADHALTWEYDELNRNTRQANDSGTAASAADDIVDTLKYHGLGQLTEQANYDPDRAPGISRPF